MAYLTADELLDTEDGFTEWNEDAAAGSTEETLEQALAEERLAELESELEQDEHPVNYDAELETEEEEAAPVSDKRLKREIRAESIRRLEEAARTEKDFWTVVEEWNKLDRNRERRERDHENLRGDVPLSIPRGPASQHEAEREVLLLLRLRGHRRCDRPCGKAIWLEQLRGGTKTGPGFRD